MPALILTQQSVYLHSLQASSAEGTAYTWIVNISGLCGFIAWVGIAVSHYRFRRAFIAQGRDLSELPYKAWLFPVGPILAFILASSSLLVKTTPLSQAIQSTGMAYPLRTSDYQSSSQYT